MSERLKIHTGDKVPSFRASTVQGAPVSFPDDYKGKVVLLGFWATWCSPCVKALQALTGIYERYHSQGLEILGVSLDETNSAQKLVKFCQSHNMPWPQILDTVSPEIHKRYHIDSIPQAFLLDGDTGKVLFKADTVDEEFLSEEVEKAMSAKRQR